MSSLTLRVIHINDVYELVEFPHIANLLRESKAQQVHTILTLAGDFVAPSLLSSLDFGLGMLGILNAVGVTHVSFGNHETDIPDSALRQRITEFKGKWLNSNMPGYHHEKLVQYDSFTIESADGTQKRKVALIGLLCGYPSLYRAGAFEGAISSIVPVNKSAQEWNNKFKAEGHDLVIPLTHQDLSDDRILAQTGVFPLILAGHDHTEYFETYNNSLLIKSGLDAHKATIIDIVWDNKETTTPKVTYVVKQASDYPADPTISELVQKYELKLHALEKAMIYQYEKGVLSSKQTREKQTTAGALFATACREALGIDAVAVDGGAVRGNQDYNNGILTLSDIKKEFYFTNDICAVQMQGKDFIEVVKYSRRNEGQKEEAGYLQVDDGVEVVDKVVTKIKNEPIDPNKEYRIGFLVVALDGMNPNLPLIEWTKKNPDKVNKDSSRPGKPLLLEYFAKQLWLQLPSFNDIDTDKSGALSIAEVKQAYRKVFAKRIDFDKDGVISPEEEEAVNNVVNTLVESLNKDGDDKISADEYYSFFGSSHHHEAPPDHHHHHHHHHHRRHHHHGHQHGHHHN